MLVSFTSAYCRLFFLCEKLKVRLMGHFQPEEKSFAVTILDKAASVDWAPLQHEGRLHDRASYRFYWQCLERAHRAGLSLPQAVRHWFI
jgi:citrate lyase subunit beta/citryl-CoA lyase